MTANVSGIDLTLNKVTYINGNPKIDETRSPTMVQNQEVHLKNIYLLK